MLLEKEIVDVKIKKDFCSEVKTKYELFELLESIYGQLDLYTCRLSSNETCLNYDYLLVYQNKYSTKPMFIMSCFSDFKLSKNDILDIYSEYEDTIKNKYNVKNIVVVSLKGYNNCDCFDFLNIRLDGIEYLNELINSVLNDKPVIELFAHNKKAYNLLDSKLKQHDKVSVVQATGTGKSFIIFKLLLEYDNDNKIIVAPSNFIVEQFKENYPGDLDKVFFFTYQKFYTLTEEEIKDISPKIVVFDEMHRLGAKKWANGYNNLDKCKKDSLKDLKIVGFSATPIRFLDGGRNMVEEFFDGVCAKELTLTDAISKEILPMPTYISAIYTMDDIESKYLEKIDNAFCSKITKIKLKDTLNKAKINWSNTASIDKILAKHININNNNEKFIVFCENIKHMEDVKDTVMDWFKSAFPSVNVNCYFVNSLYKNSKEEFCSFKSNNSFNTIDLLFSVNMLNEGVHLKNALGNSVVSGVIFLRNTRSMSVFFQQMGRALDVNTDKNPLIFDFVNNLSNIGGYEFKKEIDYSLNKEKLNRESIGLKYINDNNTLNVYDYTLSLNDFLNEIENNILSIWDLNYQRLKEFVKNNGHCNISKKTTDDKKLVEWAKYQRGLYKDNELSLDKINLLNNLGFVWNVLDYEWNKKYDNLVDYYNLNGHSNVNQLKDDRALAMWVADQRKLYKANKLSKDKMEKLNALDFIWSVPDKLWNDAFSEFKEYVEKHGTSLVKKEVGSDFLYKWCITQRRRRKGGRLSDERIAMLDDLGFEWDAVFANWMERYNRLIEYKSIYGHCDVSSGNKDFSDIVIWTRVQRDRYSKGELDKRRIDLLEKIGFVWVSRLIKDNKTWDNYYDFICRFKNEYGHCNILQRYTKGNSIYPWFKEQLELYADNKLPGDKYEKIKKLDCDELFMEKTWYSFYLKYKKEVFEAGKTGFLSEIEDKSLNSWVRTQRQIYNRKKMSPRKMFLLNKVSFIWVEGDFNWNARYDELVEFKKRFGTCDVPKKWFENEPLSHWVRNQKRAYASGKLNDARKLKLDSLNFMK